VATNSSPTSNLLRLGPFDESGELNAVIDTPKGSRNKYEYDERRGVFKLGGVMPAGSVFPFDFGYVPGTLGGDGDPLDVLVLMDEPAFVGCVVPARLIGVIEAEQTERGGETERNDRLVAVAAGSRNHEHLESLEQLNDNLVAEIEHFFVSYNEVKGKRFEPVGRSGPKRARELVEAGVRLRRKQKARRRPAKKSSTKTSGG
jgi:inorganic pyrophosphatase